MSPAKASGRERATAVQIVDADQVRPSAYNPRKADAERLDLVALSLRKFGWLLPIYADDAGEILSGHQRHHVATTMLGATQVPVVRTQPMDKNRRMAVNILFNRATNDLAKHDVSTDLKADLLSRADTIAAAEALPDIPVDCPAWFPCAAMERVPTADLVAVNEPWRDQHGLSMARQTRASGLPHMPVIATLGSLKVVNGLARLTVAAMKGEPDVPVVWVPEEAAEPARLLLNRLSMDFSLEERYADILRYNSYRRAMNKQEFLVYCHVADLLRRGKKVQNGSARRFDQDNPAHMAAWRKHYGTCVLDFGCGHFDQVKILNERGVKAVGFEPFYSPPGTDEVSTEASRARAREFLAEVAAGTAFTSIFLSSVLNSVPFVDDRRKIITIVAALSDCATAVHAVAVSTDSSRWSDHQRANLRTTDHSRSAIALDYEPHVMVAELADKPKAQKFHTLPEWRDLWSERFARVEPYMAAGGGLVACVARSPRPVEPADLRAALALEFDLPMPDGSRLGLVREALDAFAARTGMGL
ncbi:MAG: ParB N-terminal domain-containing protein [Actinomycetota bacterium]